jgi:uncharacterized protein YciI
MFIVILKYIKPLSEVDTYADAHVAFLNKFFEQNKFVVSGRQNPRTGGIILVSNVTNEELKNIIKEDPFYEHNLAEYDIKEFIPVKYQDAFIPFI